MRPDRQRPQAQAQTFARHTIKCVEIARDISAEEATAAMNAPWPKDWPPLPKFDEL